MQLTARVIVRCGRARFGGAGLFHTDSTSVDGQGYVLPLSVIPWAFCPLITYRSLRAPPRAARPGNSGPE